ncbi:MAG: insulinase family protein [Fimbriimonas ginsengisoli]|uniref:Insulinase family protein n=1 Tax=Fimbriimonas ginsengisoli TaxID=1005039 RepID=A0A931LUB9_FIMGI|nr:insulinase family protein [Fimbriimonas ginsengisoli]
MPDPTASMVVIEAVVFHPKAGPYDQPMLEVLARTLFEGTDTYPRDELRRLSLGSGGPLRCSTMPDALRIEIGVSPDRLAKGLAVLRSLLTEPLLPDAVVERVKAELPFANRSPWAEAQQPEVLNFGLVRQPDLARFSRRLFRSNHLSVAVSGPFRPNEARDAWMRATSDWQDDPVDFSTPEAANLPEQKRHSKAVTTIELRGTEFSAADTTVPAKVLAAFALGVGKQSAVFRVLRERLRLSYRQEAFLWPTAGGFVPRVVFAVKPSEREGDLGAKAADALRKDVASWTETDRQRAFAMAEAVFERGLDLNPMHLSLLGPQANSQDGRTFLAAYWPVKMGSPWNERRFMASLRAVSLETMRSEADASLATAKVYTISGL